MSVLKDNKYELNKTPIYTERRRLLFFGLPWTFTKFMVSEDMVTISSGLISRIEDDCYMYKVLDVQLKESLIERLFGLGTIICYTGDVTHPEIYLQHIKNAKEIKNFLLDASEKAKMKRKTINMLDIDGDFDVN